MQVFNFTLSTKNVFSKNVTIPSMVHASAFYKEPPSNLGEHFFELQLHLINMPGLDQLHKIHNTETVMDGRNFIYCL